MNNQTTPAPLPITHHFDPSIDQLIPTPITQTMTVGIHIHLYYQSLLDEFIGRLRNTPFKYDLLVSVTDDSQIPAIESKLRAALTHVDRIIIEKVPNRGRDIAPMIVQFGKRLLEYDIIAHFHTKKTQHAQIHRLGDMWRDHILTRLAGCIGNTGGRSICFLSLFQSDGVKLIYPEPFPVNIAMRYSWGTNFNIAKSFLEKHTKCDISKYRSIEFTMGSMFWAKSECLRELLSADLKWSDFPPEPCGTDGTLSHAIERLILLIADKYPGYLVQINQ